MKMRMFIDPACPVGVLFAVLLACSGEIGSPPSTLPGAPTADVLDPIVGVADPGDDPAVVSVESAGALLCAGALVAPDVVLTSRGCVSAVPSCALGSTESLRDPATLDVRVGDEEETAPLRAHARGVVLPPLSDPCAAEIALLLLDRPIDDIQPLVVRATGVATGDHVRTVGFGSRAGAVVKVVRDHVDVVATNATEILLRETSCECGCGGPAIDEETGEIVGVVAGVLAGVEAGAADVGARADAFLAAVRQALAEGAPLPIGGTKAKEKKGPVDLGGNCVVAGDCAAGVCVTSGLARYCSRTCASNDGCPAGFRCERSAGPTGPVSVCVETRLWRPALRRSREADKLKSQIA